MKRMLALVLGAVLFTGCSAGPLRLTPEQPAQSTPAPQAAQARVLTVCDPDGVLTAALEAYSAAQGVEVAAAGEDQAALTVRYQPPTSASAKDLSGNGALLPIAAGVGNEGACYGLPFGSNNYGYLADLRMLRALLGQEFDQKNLKRASRRRRRPSFCGCMPPRRAGRPRPRPASPRNRACRI